MSRSLLCMVRWGFIAGVGLLATRATADGEQCRADRLEKPRETEFPLLYAPRHDEFTLEVRYLGSSLPVRSAIGFGLMYSFAPLDQRLHLGLRAGGTAGEWGSDDRGPWALTLGARVAYDLHRPMDGVVDIYMLAQADTLLLASTGGPVLRPAVGLGLRVARTIAVEGTFEPLVSLGGSFANDVKFVGGFGVGVSFDLCALGTFCDERSAHAKEIDLTHDLYEAAVAMVPTDEAQHRALCAAVLQALDATRYYPHDRVDSTEAFLAGVLANLSDPHTQADVLALQARHAALDAKRNASHGAALSAAADDHEIAENCVYEPFPSEIRAAFACE